MNDPLRVCRHCDQPIADPDDAVIVAQELGNSGPGWTVWAHRDHADLVNRIPDDALSVWMKLWAAGS